MTELLAGIPEILTAIGTSFTTISTLLIGNPLFMLVVGIVFFGIGFKLVMSLVAKIRKAR